MPQGDEGKVRRGDESNRVGSGGGHLIVSVLLRIDGDSGGGRVLAVEKARDRGSGGWSLALCGFDAGSARATYLKKSGHLLIFWRTKINRKA
nr:unnamed protein product [Digitaria exilis]